jgi:hypothetical protein
VGAIVEATSPQPTKSAKSFVRITRFLHLEVCQSKLALPLATSIQIPLAVPVRRASNISDVLQLYAIRLYHRCSYAQERRMKRAIFVAALFVVTSIGSCAQAKTLKEQRCPQL